MKMKHNKKRNTAFLYESLITELTKSIVKKDDVKKNTIIEIIKKYFSSGSNLKKELNLYRTILESEKRFGKLRQKRNFQFSNKAYK